MITCVRVYNCSTVFKRRSIYCRSPFIRSLPHCCYKVFFTVNDFISMTAWTVENRTKNRLLAILNGFSFIIFLVENTCINKWIVSTNLLVERSLVERSYTRKCLMINLNKSIRWPTLLCRFYKLRCSHVFTLNWPTWLQTSRICLTCSDLIKSSPIQCEYAWIHFHINTPRKCVPCHSLRSGLSAHLHSTWRKLSLDNHWK